MKKRLNRRRFLELSAGALVISGLDPIAAHAQSAVSTSIQLNGSSSGRTFDGIGAISGGGGNSRLLIDYSDPYRSQILDYLFKPNYGANLHVLKVEIGGDTNSTDGSEASFMHTATDQNFNRGYEWWLMQQAKARNPNIKLYALAWGAPGWIGTTGAPVWDTNNRIWSQDMVNYLIAWIKGAKSQYNLTIDYVGGWNERGYNKQFYEALHSAIQSNGLSTRVVGADSDWSIADAMVSDSTFNASVDIVGAHYPCGYLGAESGCSTSSNALSLNKPLWASENGSEDYNSGAQAMARAINRGYINAKMTAYNNWPVIASIYDNLAFNTCGLMYANKPWAGSYSVGKQLWTTAHTTQFTQPGWHYLDTACGYLGGSGSNGSYVTLKSTNGSDYSVIIETVDATASQTVSFQISNGLSTGTVSVWASNLNSSNASNYFVQQASITPSGGAYSLTLQPGYVYSLSTTTGQGKGTAVGAPPSGLALPYSDNFDNYTDNQEARYFCDMNGSFEIVAAGGGRSGKVMRQMCPIAPHTWDSGGYPNSLFGDLSWTNYTVTIDVLLEQPTSVQLLGRVGTQAFENSTYVNAYVLQIDNSGGWSILKNSSGGSISTLKSGSVSALGTNSWHTLSLSFTGSTITAAINGTTVGTVTDSSYGAGQVAIGVQGWQNVQFDNFSVTANGTATSGTYYNLVNVNSSMALDISSGSTSAGALVVQNPLSSATSQQWQLVSASAGYSTLVNRKSGLVLDVPGASTTEGTQLDQSGSNGGANQQWQLVGTSGGAYTIVNKNSGLLADVSGASTTSGAPVIQWASNGGANQQWRLLPVPTAGVTYQLVNSNSGKVMDVNGASLSAGGTIIQYTNHSGTNQEWTLSDAGSGYFTLVNVNSGMVLDVPNISNQSDLQLDQWTSNGGTNQQWLFTSVGGGYYTITSHSSGQLVSVSGASTADSAAVVQNPADNGAEQQWSLLPIS